MAPIQIPNHIDDDATKLCTVYTVLGSLRCRLVKECLTQHGIPFVERDEIHVDWLLQHGLTISSPSMWRWPQVFCGTQWIGSLEEVLARWGEDVASQDCLEEE